MIKPNQIYLFLFYVFFYKGSVHLFYFYFFSMKMAFDAEDALSLLFSLFFSLQNEGGRFNLFLFIYLFIYFIYTYF